MVNVGTCTSHMDPMGHHTFSIFSNNWPARKVENDEHEAIQSYDTTHSLIPYQWPAS